MSKQLKIHCGLCQVDVDDWLVHLASAQHIANLKSPSKINAALDEHLTDQIKFIPESDANPVLVKHLKEANEKRQIS